MLQLFKENGKNITWELFNAISALMALQPGNLCSTGRGLCCQSSQNGLGEEGAVPLLSLPQHLTQSLQSTDILERLGFKLSAAKLSLH